MNTSHTILCSLVLWATAVVAATPAANPGSYDVSVEVSDAGGGGGSTWRYTITRSTNQTKDLGHFIVNFGSCGDQSPTIDSILAVTVNGVDWSNQIEASEGSLVKFDNLPEADSWVIEFTLDDVYPLMETTAWFKSGTSRQTKPVQGPGCKGYLRTTAMDATPQLVGQPYTGINTYMRGLGFDFTEHPNCTGGFGGHIDGVHGAVDLDSFFNKHVFRFDIHIDPVIDGDRCSSGTVDRQRNEMKSITNNSTWAKVQGNWDEWQIVEWKFKLPAGLQPTANFFHIHQLKAQDGPNNGSAVITITPRSTSAGTNNRIQLIHSVDGASTGKGTIVDNIPLADFENEWVQVREEVHYTHQGYYSCKITRIRDGRVLVDYRDENIDMWRIGSSYIRSKFGLYRSLAGGRLDRDPVGQSPLLKNESIWITDIRVYEKNPNPTPGVPHD